MWVVFFLQCYMSKCSCIYISASRNRICCFWSVFQAYLVTRTYLLYFYPIRCLLPSSSPSQPHQTNSSLFQCLLLTSTSLSPFFPSIEPKTSDLTPIFHQLHSDPRAAECCWRKLQKPPSTERPSASASPGGLWEVQSLSPVPGSANQNLHFNKNPWWFLCTLKLAGINTKHWCCYENHGP